MDLQDECDYMMEDEQVQIQENEVNDDVVDLQDEDEQVQIQENVEIGDIVTNKYSVEQLMKIEIGYCQIENEHLQQKLGQYS